MGENGSPSERQNLAGQLNSGIKLCTEKGIIEKVLEDFGSNIKKQIKTNYQLK